MSPVAPPPDPARRTLVVIADQDEAVDLVPRDSTPFWRVRASGANEQMAWQFGNLTVVVTGSGGPAITAVTARFLLDPPEGIAYDEVINFGSCGRYGWSEQTELLGAYFVTEALQWDLSFNFRGWDYANGTMRLAPPAGWTGPSTTCFSGGRYSDPSDRHWPMWLTGDLEEYELYSLAWLCLELGMPLAGLKFVTDSPDANAAAQKDENMAKARLAGTAMLRRYLSGDFGAVPRPPVNLASSRP